MGLKQGLSDGGKKGVQETTHSPLKLEFRGHFTDYFLGGVNIDYPVLQKPSYLSY